MKKLFVLILTLALAAAALSACSMTGITRKTTTATEKPAATQTATEAPAATEATTATEAPTVEPEAEATVSAN